MYRVNLKVDGIVERYKGRLVAKGHHQLEGIDFQESFSLVAKVVTVRILLIVAAANSWPLHQLDINNAFLHGHLDEEVYMEAPEGYDKVRKGQVCKLKRSFYGLKQASRQWNIELTTQFKSYGFKQSTHDHCLFTLSTASCFLALLVYVDDILLTGNSEAKIQKVKQFLDYKFTIKDLEHAKYFLGLELVRSVNDLYVHQRKYILDLLQDTGLVGCKPAATPLPKGVKFSSNQGELIADPQQYRSLIGRLLYLGFTRPDISYATQQLS